MQLYVIICLGKTVSLISTVQSMLSISFMTCNFQGRSHLNHEKEVFAHEHPHIKTLEEVVKTIKPTAIIGNYVLYCTVQYCIQTTEHAGLMFSEQNV